MNSNFQRSAVMLFSMQNVWGSAFTWRLLVMVLAANLPYTELNGVAQTETNVVPSDLIADPSATPGITPHGGPEVTTPNTGTNNPAATPIPSTLEDMDTLKRFDIYLSTPEVPKDKVDGYIYNISLILSLLSDNNPSGARKMLPLLTQSSELDEGLSAELEGKIDTILEVQQLKSKIEKSDADLQKLLDKPDRTPDEIADSLRKQSEEQGREGKPKASIPNSNVPTASDATIIPPPPGIQETPELTQEYIRNIQSKAKIDANEQNKAELLREARAEFVMYVSRLYEGRHYYHVILAAGFYRQLFHLDSYPEDMNAQVTDSLDINSKVSQALEDLQLEIAKGNISQAADRLQKAYGLSNSSPEIFQVPLSQKKPIQTYRRQLYRLGNMLREKDFASADSAVLALNKAAPDFNPSPIIQYLSAVETESEALLKKGKILIRQGDIQTAILQFQKAEQIWPTNPDLQGGALPLLKLEESKTRSLVEFSQLMDQKDYSTIYARTNEFTIAVGDDSVHQQQLQAALMVVANANAAIAKANALQANGDFDGAWEIIQRAIADWPENIKLNKIRGDLVNKAADFAIAIGNANAAENRQELGLSLSWYAVAQHYYPLSVLAKEGILRLSKAILERS